MHPPARRDAQEVRAREPDAAELSSSARRAALPTTVATAAVLGAGAWAVGADAIGILARFAFDSLPRLSAFAFANGMLLALPAVLPWAAARLLRSRVRSEVARSPAHGRAAAAGACLGTTGTAAIGYLALFLGYGTLAHPGAVMFWLAGLPLAIAMSIGILGALLFREVEKAAGDESRPLPVVYPGLVAAGVIGPAAMASFFLGGLVLSPVLEAAVAHLATPGLAFGAWMATSYACFLPMAYLVPRQVRRTFPRSSTRAVALGAAIPGVLYAFSDLAEILHRSAGAEQLGLLVALGLSVGAWVLLAFRGARAGEPLGEPSPRLTE